MGTDKRNHGTSPRRSARLETGLRESATAARPKSELYVDLLPLINSRRIELLDDARLLNQLCALERRTARGHRDSIDHPPGAHDDLINAVAGVPPPYGSYDTSYS